MPEIVSMSHDDLVAAYTWPFGPERGYIYDDAMMAHWYELQLPPGTVVVADQTFSKPVDNGTSDLGRAQWVALSTRATIDRVLAQKQLGERLGDGTAETVLATNRSDLAALVDGLLASPPACDVVPLQPVQRYVVVVIAGQLVVIPIPPPGPVPQLEWEDGASLSRTDLLGAGVRLRATADTLDPGPLRDEFVTAAGRLFEAARYRG